MGKDLGDFQTPPALVSAILRRLNVPGGPWARVLEPTCGGGNFIKALLNLDTPRQEIHGIELQPAHVARARALARETAGTLMIIHEADIFRFDLARDLHWQAGGPLLVIGNPPWVTNAELGALGSMNLPRKTNLNGLTGFDAITGSSNFDIAEAIWIKLMTELAPESPTIALLCKTTTARNVLQFAARAGLPMYGARMWRIDARRWFKAAVEACLFCVEVRPGTHEYEAQVFDTLDSSAPCQTWRVVDDRLVAVGSDQSLWRTIEGSSPLEWRQGVKHDAASVVELIIGTDGIARNKRGDEVCVEPSYVYPLLKSSDLAGRRESKAPERAIIVPQRRMAEDTRPLRLIAPQLWAYLTTHSAIFERRKSSVYRHQPHFAYLGLGAYSFAPYKVAVSGLYKSADFRARGPIHGRPVMLDDTCYFLPCSSSGQAALVVALLNDPMCQSYIQGVAFWDAKRPITKRLLQRIDLIALLGLVDRRSLLERATAERARLEGMGTGDSTEWPENLEALLREGSVGSSQAVQLALIR